MSRIILDTGAFIALDRNDRPMWRRLAIAQRDKAELVTHAGIVGQVWRQPRRQARLAQAMKSVDVLPLTNQLARASGLLLAATKSSDVHDAALALLCEPRDVLLTSDVDDLSALLSGRGAFKVGIIRV